MNDRRVLVVGLDRAPGELVFDRSAELPVLRGLIEQGVSGNLRSSDPPITIPAWMVMATDIYILADPKQKAAGRKLGADILDIAPTVLDIMGIPVPKDMKGKVIPKA